jgi:hypothetical protein
MISSIPFLQRGRNKFLNPVLLSSHLAGRPGSHAIARTHTHPCFLYPGNPIHPSHLDCALTSKDAEKEKVEKAARPMPPMTTKVLAFQFLGLANHPPEGVQMCVGK